MVSNAQTHTVRELPLGQRGWGVWNAFVGRRPFSRGTTRGQVGTARSGRVCMSSKRIRDESKFPQIHEVLNIKHHRSQDLWHLWRQVKTRHAGFGTGLYAIKPNQSWTKYVQIMWLSTRHVKNYHPIQFFQISGFSWALQSGANPILRFRSSGFFLEWWPKAILRFEHPTNAYQIGRHLTSKTISK